MRKTIECSVWLWYTFYKKKVKHRKDSIEDSNLSLVQQNHKDYNYKDIIEERDIYIKELKEHLEIANKKLENKEKDYEKLLKTVNVSDKLKFIQISKCILSGFATSDDLLDLPLTSSNGDTNQKFVRIKRNQFSCFSFKFLILGPLVRSVLRYFNTNYS
jgi:hypothetical protein